ncbi:hypothetical protein [Rhodopila sp.]|uniref:hypothetical protein n=1 Tax=Rhodopila sp. TaxID=2480087 RepID=UPI003D0E3225
MITTIVTADDAAAIEQRVTDMMTGFVAGAKRQVSVLELAAARSNAASTLVLDYNSRGADFARLAAAARQAEDAAIAAYWTEFRRAPLVS